MNLSISEKRASLWEALSSKGFVTGEVPSVNNIESPWYVRLLIGFSGWLAALFMLGFIGTAFEFVFRNNFAGFVVGSTMIFVAYLLLKKKSDSDFSSQFALAVSFAGQALVVFSLDLFQWFSASDSLNWILLCALQVVLTWFMPNSIHRVWSAFAAVMSMTIALTIWHVYFIQTALIMAAVAVVWLNEFNWIKYQNKLKPIGYGVTLALLYQSSSSIFHFMFRHSINHNESIMQPWLGELFVGLVMFFVVWQLLKRQNTIPILVLAVSFIAALLLIMVS
ncbi:MAG: DUF4401 domain-containing protein, partial [Gammaproteobacteria bacterium]|nr:DUF4401 domain-containing protein [Gammaproteobacteria bacterium]